MLVVLYWCGISFVFGAETFSKEMNSLRKALMIRVLQVTKERPGGIQLQSSKSTDLGVSPFISVDPQGTS